jgi:ATP-binding cassette, subfamily B, bacterial MsbA
MIFKNITKIILPSEWLSTIAKANQLEILHKKDVVLVGVITLVAVIFETFGMGMMFPLLQYVENDGNYELLASQSSYWIELSNIMGFVGVPINLISLSSVVFLMLMLRQCTSALRDILLETSRAKAAKKLSESCFYSILDASGQYIQRVGSGNFSILVSSQAQSGASVIRNLAELWKSCITVIGYIIIISLVAFIPVVIAVVVGAFILICISPLIKMVRKTSKQLIETKSNFSQYLVERISAWRLLKVSQGLIFERRFVNRYTSRLAAIDVRIAKISNLMIFIVILSQSFLLLFLLNIGVSVLELQLSTIALLFAAMYRMMPIVNGFSKLRQTNANIDAYLSQVLKYKNESELYAENTGGSKELISIDDKINYENVSFTYEGTTKPVLHNITLSLPTHSIIAIAGPSGAGKSTFVDLLPRLIENQDGTIRFDGTSINEFSLEGLRKAIEYVGQTPLILNGSVSDNVKYAQQNATREEIIHACKLANAHEFITDLSDGYDTQVGEGGTLLSGGQRQRLSLARSFLSNATLIILDEPTSALDVETEKKIHESLMRVVKERGSTLIIIAHRPSTILASDFVVVLENGHLVDYGATNDVVKNDGWLSEIIQASNIKEVIA